MQPTQHGTRIELTGQCTHAEERTLSARAVPARQHEPSRELHTQAHARTEPKGVAGRQQRCCALRSPCAHVRHCHTSGAAAALASGSLGPSLGRSSLWNSRSCSLGPSLVRCFLDSAGSALGHSTPRSQPTALGRLLPRITHSSVATPFRGSGSGSLGHFPCFAASPLRHSPSASVRIASGSERSE